MARAKRYASGDPSKPPVTLAGLKRLGRGRQVQVMLAWFGEHFVDDPAKVRIGGLDEANLASSPLGWEELKPLLEHEFGRVVPGAQIDEAVRRIGPGTWHPAIAFGFAEQAAPAGVWGQSAWNDGSLWSDGTGWLDDTLPDIIARLEAGLKLRFGDDEETTRRQDLLQALGDLQGNLVGLRASGYGGNSGERLPSIVQEIEDAADRLRQAVDTPEPNGLEAAKEASRLQRIGAWIGKEALKESFKEGILKPFLPRLARVVEAVITWLT